MVSVDPFPENSENFYQIYSNYDCVTMLEMNCLYWCLQPFAALKIIFLLRILRVSTRFTPSVHHQNNIFHNLFMTMLWHASGVLLVVREGDGSEMMCRLM